MVFQANPAEVCLTGLRNLDLDRKALLLPQKMGLPPLQWLISPDDGLPLQTTDSGFCSAHRQYIYPIEEAVAVLLPAGSPLAHYAEHYQRDAEYFDYRETWEDDPAARHENRRLHETILAQLPRSSRLKVLDVGCGSAWLAGALLPLGHEVVSMDISTVNPRRALETYPSERHYGVVADAFHLPFANGLFDVIIAGEVIEHVPDPAALLASLLRVLSPGGKLVVTTPYNEKIQYCLCIHCNRPTPHSAHLHSFTAAKLLDMLPPAVRRRGRTFTFMNKGLLKLRTHVALQYLPYAWWKRVDALANYLLRKPARLALVWE